MNHANMICLFSMKVSAMLPHSMNLSVIVILTLLTKSKP